MTARRMFAGWATPDRVSGPIAEEYRKRCAQMLAKTGRQPDLVTLVDEEHVLVIGRDAATAAAWCDRITRSLYAVGAVDDPDRAA
ncbi:MAG TPA: hypothetical protein VNT51_11220 [Miltoncostaeaceae bacterium]|nr:hypothetical protein [Miltoncostaeaceae bacterium]